ncbi:HAMP domain-containing protein [bacterium]|nr:HAMP domain-containing protein [bacterium]
MKKNDFKIKLSVYVYFITFATATIVITSILFVIYLYLNLNVLLGKYNADLETMSSTVLRVLAQTVANDIDKGNFDASKKIILLLKSEHRITYAYVKDDQKDIVILDDVKDESQEKQSNEIAIKPLSRQIPPKYTVYAGMPTDKKEMNIYESFSKMIWQILFVFIFFAGFASFVMARIISRPLSKLSKAAKQISEGNFDIKIDESRFLFQFHEINDLIFSYNEMAHQLHELYSSLELKVQERTIALEAANYKLKETQAMMVHSEKMRSLGALVAGIAHEINNPVNFIHGNIMILQNYADDLFKLIDLYEKNDINLPEDLKEQIVKLKKDIDLDFLRTDINDLIKSCIEGTQRTKNIVLDLKNFSRMEEMVLTQFDIPKEIDTTLNILNNKYKNRITVIKNYSPDVPKIEAYGGQLNQVFMNILDNAQDAMKDKGTLTINVDKIKDKVKIEFIDTGVGIPKENLKKVFDPFFTTKAVGKGTGLGMSISYRVINDHHGTINVDSVVGKGTKFTIILPINYSESEVDVQKQVENEINNAEEEQVNG